MHQRWRRELCHYFCDNWQYIFHFGNLTFFYRASYCPQGILFCMSYNSCLDQITSKGKKPTTKMHWQMVSFQRFLLSPHSLYKCVLFFKIPRPSKCIKSICCMYQYGKKIYTRKTKEDIENKFELHPVERNAQHTKQVWHVVCCVDRTPLILVFHTFGSNFLFLARYLYRKKSKLWKIELNVCVNEFTLSKLIFIKKYQ